MMLKKRSIAIFVIVLIVAMTSWFVYPRYKLYQFLEEYRDVDSFHELCYAIGWDFTNCYDRFYQYPESSEDSIFRALSYENYEYLVEPYIYGVFLREETMTINDSVLNMFCLYLKGPNHDDIHVGKIINPYDYENDIITPVNVPFYKFLFSKGDILVGIIPEHNPCDYSYPQNFAYKEKLDVPDTIAGDTFRRAISFPYKEKYGNFPSNIRILYDDAAVICYEANLHADTLILTQKCEPFNGEYDTSPMVEVINKPLYTWAKEIGLHQFYFSIAVRPSFFEKK
jgi:hypothetical protein